MVLESIIETAMGPIMVSTRTIPWWLAFLTVGIFRKVESRMYGSVFERCKELGKEWRKHFGFRIILPQRSSLWETRVSCMLVLEIKPHHQVMAEYARAIGDDLDAIYAIGRLHRKLEKAREIGDRRSEYLIAQEIQDLEEKRLERIYGQNSM